MYVLHNIQALSFNSCYSGKAMSIRYVSVVLGTQHAMRMRHIVICLPAPLYNIILSTLSHKRYDFRKKVTEHKMCVLIFCTTFV
jgi:hypothetical protein